MEKAKFESEYLTIGELASLTEVRQTTIGTWIRAGKLPTPIARFGREGRRGWPRSRLDELTAAVRKLKESTGSRKKSSPKPEDEYVRIGELAKLTNVHPTTIRNWIRSGELIAPFADLGSEEGHKRAWPRYKLSELTDTVEILKNGGKPQKPQIPTRRQLISIFEFWLEHGFKGTLDYLQQQARVYRARITELRNEIERLEVTD